MSARSGKNKKGNYKGLIILMAVVAAMAAISLFAGWYFSNGNGKEPATEQTEKPIPPSQAVQSPLDGTWASKYDGAILTVNGLSFSVELPSVDKPVIVAGTLRVNGQTAVFKNISANAQCKGVEGTYRFTVKDKDLQFQLVRDDCAGRKERMTAGWFAL